MPLPEGASTRPPPDLGAEVRPGPDSMAATSPGADAPSRGGIYSAGARPWAPKLDRAPDSMAAPSPGGKCPFPRGHLLGRGPTLG